MDYQDVDEDGNVRVGWIQEQKMSCGPACVYMLLAQLNGACLPDGEKRIRDLISMYFTDSPGMLVERWRNGYERLGVELSQVQAALRSEGVSSRITNGVLDKGGTVKWPLIAQVGWADGSTHLVTCVGDTSKGKVIVLDPWHGLQQVPRDTMPIYLTTPRPYARSTTPVGGCFRPNTLLVT